MNSKPHSTCAFIPEHMLRRIAETEGPGKATAIATLEEMERLAAGRPRNFINATPKAAAPSAARRNIYDARNRERLPGVLVLSDHQAKRGKDVAVTEAWDGSGATYDFLLRVFARNSVDGRGLRLDSTVHYGLRFANAMWNGTQMVYGDGDGKLFNRFTASIEVIGHELAHGVTQSTAGLSYQGENGALNEHISDVFGIMLKQFVYGQTAETSEWLIGERLFARGVQGKAIRSMAAPGTAYDDPRLGKDPQPSHMSGYVETALDHGGVHINSGIPNHAFYRAAMAIGGKTWEVLGQIWYATLLHRLTPGAGFREFAGATTIVAKELFGSTIQRKVAAAWLAVGLPPLAPSVVQRTERRAA